MGAKSVIRGPKGHPKAPKRLPRGPQGTPKGTKMAPKLQPWGPLGVPRGAKGDLGILFGAPMYEKANKHYIKPLLLRGQKNLS